MRKKILLILVALSMVISSFGVAYAGCRESGRWEGVGIALGATTLLNTILCGVPSPVVPPRTIGYYGSSRAYYYSGPYYSVPPVVERGYYYYDYVPRVNIWLRDYPRYWHPRRRFRIYNNYNYHYNYHNHYRHYNHHDHYRGRQFRRDTHRDHRHNRRPVRYHRH